MTKKLNCRRCLLKDLDKDEYFKSIYSYIESIPDEIKTDSKEYTRRLKLCQKCDNLINGMCKVCGCFIEVRAAKKHNYCPNIKKAW